MKHITKAKVLTMKYVVDDGDGTFIEDVNIYTSGAIDAEQIEYNSASWGDIAYHKQLLLQLAPYAHLCPDVIKMLTKRIEIWEQDGGLEEDEGVDYPAQGVGTYIGNLDEKITIDKQTWDKIVADLKPIVQPEGYHITSYPAQQAQPITWDAWVEKTEEEYFDLDDNDDDEDDYDEDGDYDDDWIDYGD